MTTDPIPPEQENHDRPLIEDTALYMVDREAQQDRYHNPPDPPDEPDASDLR